MSPVGKRAVCGVLALALVAGCGTNHTAAKSVLVALAVGSAALAVGSAVKSRSVQNDLEHDLAQNSVTGREFVDRDATGTRWNRIGRASAFAGVVFVLGLVAVFETESAERIQRGPLEWTPANDPRPIFPPPPAGTAQSRASAR